jgi:uncharacterized protein YecA (UPF0149 family)
MGGDLWDSPYAYTTQDMKDLGFCPKFQRNRPDLMRPHEQGRNEKCACGSGLKYKKCCGKEAIHNG